MSRRFPGVGDVIAAYRPKFVHELRTEWAIALVYRPFSFLLTPLFAALGLTPSAVTLLGFACACVLPFAAVSGGPHGWLLVGALGVVFCVLDCIDGDLARVTGRASTHGAYLDFAVDIVYRVSMYASIGIVADRIRESATGAAGDQTGLVAGLVCALLAVVARACRLYADASAAAKRGGSHPTENGVAMAFLSGLDHLLPIAVLALGAIGRLDWALLWLFAYSLADLLQTQASVWKRLS